MEPMQHQCIDSETLADYLEGRLANQALEQVEFHLSECDRCLEDMLMARRALFERPADCMQAVPSAVTQRAVDLVVQTTKGSWWDALMGRWKAFSLEWTRMLHKIGFTPPGALAPVRGRKTQLSDDRVLLTQAFSALDAEIEIEKIDAAKANLNVSVSGPAADRAPVRITLVRKEREVASYLVDPGTASFESVPSGRYTLAFTQNGKNIGQYDFSILTDDDGGLDA
jgi:hypothetical protein